MSPLYETVDVRLRRLQTGLMQSQERQRDLRNQAAELQMRTQFARQEAQEARVSANLRAARQRGQVRFGPFAEQQAIFEKYRIPGTDTTYEFSPADQARFDELNTIIEGAPATARAGTLGPPGFLRQLTEPVVPAEINPLRDLPVIGPSAARVTSPLTTPIGAAVTAAFPAATLAGTIGGTALGTVGGGLETAGVPVAQTPIGGIGPRTVGEVVGSFATPAGLSRPGRAAIGVAERRIGQGLAAEAERAGGVRPLLAEETGTIRFPGRQPPSGPRAPAGGPPEPPGAIPPEPPWEEARDKVLTALRQSKPVTAAQATELSLERGRRITAYRSAVARNRAEGMTPRQAEREARRLLGGEVEKIPGVKIDFTEQDTSAFFRRINDYDYGINQFMQPRASVAMEKLITETPLQTNEIDVLRRVFGDEFGAALEKAAKGGGKGWDDLFDLIVLPKTVLSSFDLSYPFRQGIMVAPRHPKEFFGNIPNMARSFVSEEVANSIDDVIKNDPARVLVKQADETLTETSLGAVNQDIGIIRPFATGQRSAAEEGFLSQIGLKISGVRQSSRAFVTYGNKLRADLAKYWIQHWDDTGVDITPERLQNLGNLLNRLTGRGTLGRGPTANRVTQLLQATWWSPQYRLSGPQAFAQLFHKDQAIRKIAAQNLATFIGGGIAVLGLLKATGAAEVDVDPRSTDFGKIRAGPFRANFWGTSQLLARSIAQLATARKIDVGLGAPKPIGRGDVALGYFRSGLAPEWSLIWDIVKGENYIGEKIKLDADEALDRLAPLALQDTIEAYQAGGPLAAAATAPLSTFGVSTTTYQTDLSNQLQAIGQYRNIDPKLEDELQRRGGFYDRVETYQKTVLDETDVKPSTAMGILTIARREGKDTEFIKNALLLRQGSKTEIALRNPEWLKFVFEHKDELMSERPDLVDPEQGAPDYIIRYINAREAKASGE